MANEGIALPDLNWFDFEVLSHLLGENRYGHELLVLLNKKFGEDAVSSGKLYPALQKLERNSLSSLL